MSGEALLALFCGFGGSSGHSRRWVQQAERDQGSRQDGLRTSEREELSRLRRENRQLKMDQGMPSPLVNPAPGPASRGRSTGAGSRSRAPRQRPGSLGRPIRPGNGVRIRKSESGSICADRPACAVRNQTALLGVSTSGYYAWRVRSPSRRAQQNKELSRRIAAIHAESRQTYGARRDLWAELRATGRDGVAGRRVARLTPSCGRQWALKQPGRKNCVPAATLPARSRSPPVPG